ncbi:hypothetical protein CHCC5027_3540 [Bacillus paralicheniformis]|uniref:RecB family exonuclease n=1 Tax=Bacillus paralicheniformis TaxID=1648923 RepID=UPI0011A01E04|nr:PD-(D/E)XK nuclease family protein [Bacillus paralicheniformis]TWJ39627.1 hypothetical protein CHCC5027_3540 [Bacillus paralicheniformis]
MSYTEKQLADLAKKYPMPYISYSQITSYRKCPWTYKLTYLSGQFKSTGNKYTKLGNVFHDIVESEGRQKIANKSLLSQSGAIRIFNNNFFKVLKEHKDYFDSKEDFIKLYNKGIQAIKNYYSVYTEEIPLFVERRFQGEIAEGLPPVKSFVDRIEGDKDDPSSWIITDYKTGSQPKPKDYLRNDLQLGMYAAQLFAETGHYPKAVQFYHPVPNKFQTAVHQGDGHYKFTGQRAPVVEFSVSDVIIEVRKTVADIVTNIENDSFKRVVERWACKSCFHYISGDCDPFKKPTGWEAV